MKLFKKHILSFIICFIFSVSFSQTLKMDSLRGEFTYVLQYKPNSLNKDYILRDLFSLQISDRRAFFISENSMKFDSLFTTQFDQNKKNNTNTFDFRGFPTSKFNFLIIQTNENLQYSELIATVRLSYNSSIIDNWKLIDETKVINSISCKKAELNYKGRFWTAWYSAEIPFPYGPYKFSALPGLIVKITDSTGDYDFELVKSVPSSKMNGKLVSINKLRYENAKLVTKEEFNQAKKNAKDNIRFQMESMGTKFSQEPRIINQVEKNYYNPIELED